MWTIGLGYARALGDRKPYPGSCRSSARPQPASPCRRHVFVLRAFSCSWQLQPGRYPQRTSTILRRILNMPRNGNVPQTRDQNEPNTPKPEQSAGRIQCTGERDYHYGVTPQGLFSLRLIWGDRAMIDLTGREYYVSSLLSSERGEENILRKEACSLSGSSTDMSGDPHSLASRSKLTRPSRSWVILLHRGWPR